MRTAHLLRGLLARLGAEVSDLGILRDDPEQACARGSPRRAQGHDLVLTSGGVSTGEADYVRDAIETIGTLVFWRVAIKPGRPVAMGVLRGTAFVGLPGNPVAVFVTFARVVRPLLLRLAGAQSGAADRAAGEVADLRIARRRAGANMCACRWRGSADGSYVATQASAGWRRA